MSIGLGSKIIKNGLVFNVDSYDPKSNMGVKEVSNILVGPAGPSGWTIGNDSTSGYGRNGDITEQDRALRLDPFLGRSVTWRSTPDATSGADGGWNTSYYTVDTNYKYRVSVYVKRYTDGVGGTFYMGMNPNPIRNDNNASQGNPYFTYPSIASLTKDQWYLVVAHIHEDGYSGGRHPDSGWYEIQGDGSIKKIPDKSYGNCGSQDVRWDPTTTSARHRTYHYYTTNTASGIEWHYPRFDKIDGTQPSIKELVSKGTVGKWYNSISPLNKGVVSGTSADKPTFTTTTGTADSPKSMMFDGINQNFVSSDSPLLRTPNEELTLEAWIYPAAAEVSSGDRGTIMKSDGSNSYYLSWNKSNRKLSTYWYARSSQGYHEPGPAMNREEWHHVVAVWDGANHYHYINGVQYGPIAVTGTAGTSNQVRIGMESTSRQFAGGISVVRIYDIALSPDDVLRNFNATRGRYGK